MAHKEGFCEIPRANAVSHLCSRVEDVFLCVSSDIAALSVEQCQTRYDVMRRKSHPSERLFSAQFITADCSKVKRARLVVPTFSVELRFKGLEPCRTFCLRSWTTPS